ncbi:hypothetical protein HKB16_15505, partial [Vibrio parahaemolyticus]|nr:hypothetical protein [Vibrio parahaemolyticus]
MKGVKLESCASTADAMQKVQEMDRDDVAAIGNASSGKLYGLQAIQGNIANQSENHTRFIVVCNSRQHRKPNRKPYSLYRG